MLFLAIPFIWCINSTFGSYFSSLTPRILHKDPHCLLFEGDQLSVLYDQTIKYIFKKWQSQSSISSFMPSYSTHRLEIAMIGPACRACVDKSKWKWVNWVELNCRHVRIRQFSADKWGVHMMDGKKMDGAEERNSKKKREEGAKWAQITDVLANKWHGSFENNLKT